MEQLRQWLAERRIEATDHVWTDGMAEWLPASQVTDLTAGGGHGGPVVPIAHHGVHPGYAAMPVHPMQAPAESNANAVVALLLWFFLGWLGIHRFYVGKIGTGILWLLTGGLLGFGTFIDGLLILFCAFNDAQGRRLQAARAASITMLVFIIGIIGLIVLAFGRFF